MVFLGTVLIVTGTYAAIVLFSLALSILLFVLIAGPGIFIGYRRKKTRQMLFFALLVISWGYFAGSLFLHLRVTVANEFIPSFFFPMTIPLGLAGLPLAWFGRWEKTNPAFGRLQSTFFTWVIYMVIVAPLVFAFTYDYNIRGDTNPPEVLSLKIIDKYINHNQDYTFYVEAPDGVLHFFLYPSHSQYDEHYEGDLIETTVHKGAFGYMWVDAPQRIPPPEY